MESFSRFFNEIRDYIKGKGYLNEKRYKKYSSVFNVGCRIIVLNSQIWKAWI